MGLPDPIRQEVVAAFVVLDPDSSPSKALRIELQDMVKRNLSPYKYPRKLEFIEALPRDHVGKVQPKVLRDKMLADLQRAES
jgi:acyl-coenzyme A synthetase/AMP-(fatty) acid ligase